MESSLFYLFKSSLVLTIFFVVYYGFLRRNTSFSWNRFFLLAGIFTSLILPNITFTIGEVVVRENFNSEISVAKETVSKIVPTVDSFNWWLVLGYLYCIVTGLLLLKFIWQFLGVLKMILTLPRSYEDGLYFLDSEMKKGPSSFFNFVIYNKRIHTPNELKYMLRHEKVHAKQLHSLDILAAHLITSTFWFNPISWYYKRSIEQNLEFIADNETFRCISNKKQYLYTLLKSSRQGSFSDLPIYFHKSFVKARILMLVKNSSSEGSRLKILLVVPFLIVFCFGFNVKEKIRIQDKSNIEVISSPEEPVFVIDYQTSYRTLAQLEKFFEEKYQDVQIKFTEVERGPQGFLKGFILKTKFSGQNKFLPRLSNFQMKKSGPVFLIAYEPENSSLRITEKGKQTNMEIRITAENTIFDN